MRITVFGATGNVGRRVVAEAVRRGHRVTAISRNTSRHEGFSPPTELRLGDIGHIDDAIRLSRDADLVVSAIRPTDTEAAVATTRALFRGLAVTGSRLLIVGGAASLVVPGTSGTTVLDDARYLSPAARHIGETSLAQYRACLPEARVDWAYLSPPADLFAGPRTGAYRLGTDELLVDANGKSRISIDDLASVILDEAERPRHHRTRFTAAY